MTLIDGLRRCDLALTGDPPVTTVEVAGTRVPLALQESDGRVSLRAEIGSPRPGWASSVAQFGLVAAGDTRFAMQDGALVGSRTLVQPTVGALYDALFELAKATCGLSQLLAGAGDSGPPTVSPSPRLADLPTQTIPAAVPPLPQTVPSGRTAPPGSWPPGSPPAAYPPAPSASAYPSAAAYPSAVAYPSAAANPTMAPVRANTGRALLATAMWSTLVVAALGVVGGLILAIVPLATGVDNAVVFAVIGAGVALVEAAFGVAAWYAGIRGRQAGRIVVTVFLALTLVGGVVNLVNGAPPGAAALPVLVAVALGVLWWLPQTTQAMRARRYLAPR